MKRRSVLRFSTATALGFALPGARAQPGAPGPVMRSLSEYMSAATGRVSRAEVIDKCRDLVGPVLGAESPGRLVEAVFAIETIADVRSLRPLLQRR